MEMSIEYLYIEEAMHQECMAQTVDKVGAGA